MPLGYERENCCWNSNKRWHYAFHPSPRMGLNEVLNSQQHGYEKECVEKVCLFSFCRSNILSCTQGLMSGPTQGPPTVGWGCIWAWWSLRKAAGYGVPRRAGRVAVLGFFCFGLLACLVVILGIFFPTFCRIKEGLGLPVVKKRKKKGVFWWPGCVIYFIK